MKNNTYISDILDDNEMWIEEHLDEFVEVDDGGAMRSSLIDAARNTTRQDTAQEVCGTQVCFA